MWSPSSGQEEEAGRSGLPVWQELSAALRSGTSWGLCGKDSSEQLIKKREGGPVWSELSAALGGDQLRAAACV